MKRLLFDVSRWHLMLHREHRGLPRANERDTPQLRLEDELFERLYTGEGERLPPGRVRSRRSATPTRRSRSSTTSWPAR